MEPLRAFPSWFLRIECDRCGKDRMLNEVHMPEHQRGMALRVLIARMRHDGCGGSCCAAADERRRTARHDALRLRPVRLLGSMFVLGLVVGTTAIMGREQPGTAVRLGHVSHGGLPVLRCTSGRHLLHRRRGRHAWELCEEGVGNSAARTVGVSGANAGKAHCCDYRDPQ
jgi:hypothetical protein